MTSVVPGSSLAIAGVAYCPSLTKLVWFNTMGASVAIVMLAVAFPRAHNGSGCHLRRQLFRSFRTQVSDQRPAVAADRH
ncbi:hypothetical protein A8144_03765 [Mycobacterium leprae 3125609]|nr:hypothetical protein A8144_03765 [Mycobacterium leprae 3125609]